MRLDVLSPDRVLVGLQRDDPRLDVEVAAELLPHHVHVGPEYQVRPASVPPAASRRWRHFHFKDSAPSMIASEEPCVRAPVVSPGALNRLARIRDAALLDLGSLRILAWSMKLRCRFSAMIRCASGSIHVVTNVARLRCGIPSRTSSSPIRRIASTARRRARGARCPEPARAGSGCRRRPRSSSSFSIIAGPSPPLVAPELDG